MRIWRNLPLGSKFAILTSLWIVFTVVALTYLTLQRMRTNSRQELIAQSNLLLETVPLTMRDPLYQMALDELADIAGLVSNNEDITMVIIYDPQGAVLYDTVNSEMVFSQDIDPLGDILIGLDQGQIYRDWQDEQLVAGRTIVLGGQTYGAVAIGLSTQAQREKIATVSRQSFLFAMAVLGLGLGLAILSARQITIPLSELTHVADRMAGGDLSVRVKVRSKDEIGRLGETFNGMVNAIQQRETELRNLAAGLERTVAERTAELRQKNEELVLVAITDPLTQCYNRRFFFELAEKEFDRAARYGHPVTVIIMDADHFKGVNDTYGHQTGDQILVGLVALCQENIRSSDIFARYGGEEFVILMPQTACKVAEEIAQRLRELVAKTPLSDKDLRITISMGIACWDGEQESDFDTLLACADRALYHSKKEGRNRVSVMETLTQRSRSSSSE